MWVFVLLFGAMMPWMVALANESPNVPDGFTGLYHLQLDVHLEAMHYFFCPWCIKYCLTGAKPGPPEFSGFLTRLAPLLVFQCPDLVFPPNLDLAGCEQECSKQLPDFLVGQSTRWVEAKYDRVPRGYSQSKLPDHYVRYGLKYVDWLLHERGRCGPDNAGPNPPGGPDAPDAAKKDLDLSEEFQRFKEARQAQQTPPKDVDGPSSEKASPDVPASDAAAAPQIAPVLRGAAEGIGAAWQGAQAIGNVFGDSDLSHAQ